jgi:hypothetical protein
MLRRCDPRKVRKFVGFCGILTNFYRGERRGGFRFLELSFELERRGAGEHAESGRGRAKDGYGWGKIEDGGQINVQ